MDTGRTGSRGPLEDPDEDSQRRSRRPQPRGGAPAEKRRTTRQRPNSTGRVGPNSSGSASRRLNQQPPLGNTDTSPSIRRASRELDQDNGPRPPRSRRLPPEPVEEEYYEPRPRSRRLPPEPVEEEYYEPRPRSRRLPPEPAEEEYYEPRPRSRRLPPEPVEEEYYEPRPRSRRLPPEPIEEEYYEPRPQRVTGSTGKNPPLYRYDEERHNARPRRKRKRALPMVLTGCGLTVLTLILAAAVFIFLTIRSSLPPGSIGSSGGSKPVTQQSSQTVNLTSVTRIQVCNNIGNVTVTTDAAANAITVTTNKSVPQNNPDEAKNIIVQIPTPGSTLPNLVCKQAQQSTGTADSPLIINVYVPINDSADITVTLPTKVLSSVAILLPVNIEAPRGNISVSNLNSVPSLMYLWGTQGNITVKNVILGNGSQLHTGSGNVLFNGALALPTDQTIQASYKLQSEQGNIDATLLPGSTNVILDTATNGGTITSDFHNTITVDPPATSGGKSGATYHGPLDPTLTPLPNVFLHLLVSFGNVTIHKAQV